ncbi:interferon-induced GTP-binding protein Mx2 [Coniochaeta ligniaria NRRL 30616]|uniref:Interferon-induced GTP-binding protein Mx2 n=1 Tax=Coniochaeta ligniaria NRRL 30616 TaxID=1408157 RepID=A0A1J7ILJ8_9PEZI|nr:interferon-induced GTP-binding protein Mx2 [Coniochaeta ligniaria NRRL 30616]
MPTKVKVEEEDIGLGNKTVLDKVDKLRALNVGMNVPLPQLIVVGDQSSGKSSVLESLTGFSFPRAAGLCTRYATQITCRRELQVYTDISIIPRPSASASEQERLRAFHRRVEGSNTLDLAKILEDANREMGIRPLDADSTDKTTSAFSEDVLKVEICGPDQRHITLIDVPGIFRTATPGTTTQSDIELVRTMVKNYMKDSRTIILAVIPSNVDIATQEILELAKAADPEGVRTLGVLTKPDLAFERVTKQNVMDLVLGKRNDLKLGYCVVKNRNGDDVDSTLQQRHDSEKAFFRNEPWSIITNTGRVGIAALQARLSELLLAITRKELPHVKAEIAKFLKQNREQLDGLGPPRGEASAQRAYLGKLSTSFQRVATCALDANYVHDGIFTDKPELRLITRVIELNEVFAHTMWQRGHMRKFETPSGMDENDLPNSDRVKLSFKIPFDDYPELEGIIEMEPYECEPPIKGSIMTHIQAVYDSSRGQELGTFGSSVLGTTFKEQSKKWQHLVMSHVSSAILIVHDSIVKLLATTIPDETVRTTFWEDVLFEKLCNAYKRAMDHARFLLMIELGSKPFTYNNFFSTNLEKRKLERYETKFKDEVRGANADDPFPPISTITFAQFRNMTIDRSNAEQVREDIHDILLSYYKVSRKRFVDAICQQAIDHFLLNGGRSGDEDDKSPMKLFDSDLVMALDDGKLENIAGEDAGTKRTREMLTAEIKKLEEALKVLRG